MKARGWLAGAFVCLAAGRAEAHKPSDSYVTLRSSGSELEGRWDIALRDLDDTVGLDRDGDGIVTWGELRAELPAVRAFALPRLTLRSGALPCTPHVTSEAVVHHADGSYVALGLAWQCSATVKELDIRYDLLFERDASHRGIVTVAGHGASHTLVFTAREREKTLRLATNGGFRGFLSSVKLGAEHIFGGYDHLLFLVALLLPAVLRREGRGWVPVPSFEVSLKDVLRTVTAFTLAHSATLVLAALGVVTLPSRWVESAIALSVVLAAANNLWPVVRADRWVAAFALGLLHGFGFATALTDAGVAGSSLYSTLFGFNLGVELGQLTFVAALLPLAFLARHGRFYRGLVLRTGSAVVALVASVWLVERAF
ncbi:MAG TPA: HupE/UreJ family protein, partial [Polyangiaceae bacterium]|nr:HupE/UreJ family protein [Polyangiaceae bacterium]